MAVAAEGGGPHGASPRGPRRRRETRALHRLRRVRHRMVSQPSTLRAPVELRARVVRIRDLFVRAPTLRRPLLEEPQGVAVAVVEVAKVRIPESRWPGRRSRRTAQTTDRNRRDDRGVVCLLGGLEVTYSPMAAVQLCDSSCTNAGVQVGPQSSRGDHCANGRAANTTPAENPPDEPSVRVQRGVEFYPASRITASTVPFMRIAAEQNAVLACEFARLHDRGPAVFARPEHAHLGACRQVQPASTMQSSPKGMPSPELAPKSDRSPMEMTSLPPPERVPMMDAPPPMSEPAPTDYPTRRGPRSCSAKVPALKFTKPSCMTVVPSAR